MKARTAHVLRRTRETTITADLSLDGKGRSKVATGIGFLDHMLTAFATHARFDLDLACAGDLHVDAHHTVEDVGIVLGQAVKQALGDMKGITRYADVHVPMDEALTRVAIDISGRPFLVFKAAFARHKVGSFDTELVKGRCRFFTPWRASMAGSMRSTGWVLPSSVGPTSAPSALSSMR